MASVTKRTATATVGGTAAASPSLSASSASSSDAPAARRGLQGLVRGLLFDHAFFPLFFVLVMLGELVLGVVIIQRVAYTEIDWIAYMQEVSGFLSGDWDYANLRGDTGPLVYPAGFVYIYSALYYITDQGKNILLAQYIFLGLYLAFIALLLLIYHRVRQCPPWVFLLLSASRRIHSIFVLRCFNDCIAMLLLYAAVYALLRHRWTIGCVLVSLALSVKMNILLFVPALAVLLCQRFGAWRAAQHLLVMLLIQVVLATPFLLVEPYNYMRLAFDFGRAFFYVWTVNLKILDEQTFLSPALAKGLLGAHLVLLVLFVHKMLAGGIVTFVVDMLRGAFVPSCTPPASVSAVVANVPKAVKKATRPSHAYIVTLLFVTNFVGIVCARSLHYQFYVWYYHTLPLLLWLTPLPTVLRLSLLAAIEYAWNVFPATAQSSGVLIAAHVVLTLALLFSKRLPPPPSTTPIELQQPQQQSKKVQ